MFKLLRYLKKYWFIALLAPTFMVGEVAMDMLLTSYMEKMVDYGIQTMNMDNVVKYGLIMLGIVAIGVLAGILSGVFTNIAAFKFSNDLRKDLYSKIMKLSLNQTDDFRTASIITRVTNDVTQIQSMVSMSLRMLIRAVSFFILGIVFTLSISIRFGTVLLIVLPIEVVLIALFIKVIFPVFKRIQAKLDKLNTVVHENVDGARVVKAFSKEPFETNRFIKANEDYTNENFFIAKMSAFAMPVISLIIYVAQIVIYYIGGTSLISAARDYIEPTLMVGQITQANTYIMMVCMHMIMLGIMLSVFARGFASASRINEILDAPLELNDGNEDKDTLTEHGTIEFKNVSFKYPGAANNALTDVSFRINQGDTVAIVGSTGCGKTTLVDLIPRFSDATEGEVLVDGRNVKDYKKTELRETVSICLQKSELFEGSIKENISYGRCDASDEEINKAASVAQVTEFLPTKEKGIDDSVGEKGSELSGGQKQRVSIARALLMNSEILIFDDSTSALDLVTEAKLHDALKREYPNTTLLIVAQRIATAKHADKIIVLDDGMVSGFDTHDNLMKNNAIYQDIYNSQLKKEEVID